MNGMINKLISRFKVEPTITFINHGVPVDQELRSAFQILQRVQFYNKMWSRKHEEQLVSQAMYLIQKAYQKSTKGSVKNATSKSK